ncbi:hypothetical protein LZ32DRAFT_603184 [Colletotrichum eremochloae]|nr:hypothetical protein LZ32DRAFT_603184 [Colletotrichum eremochloae]
MGETGKWLVDACAFGKAKCVCPLPFLPSPYCIIVVIPEEWGWEARCGGYDDKREMRKEQSSRQAPPAFVHDFPHLQFRGTWDVLYGLHLCMR